MSYYGLIYPYLKYGETIRSSSSDREIQMMLRLQKKTIKVIAGLKIMESCKDVFKDKQILTFPNLYIYKTCIHYCILNVNQYTIKYS